MKKILGSLIAIVLTIGLVGTAAYALFSDTVTVSGLTITTGTADLEISFNGNDNAFYEESHNFENLVLADNVYPGYTNSATFYLRNVSTSDISLRPSTRLTAATGDWGALSNVVQIRVTDVTDSNYSWGWQTLAWWNAVDRTITNTAGVNYEADPTGTANAHEYQIEIRVPTTAGNEISGLSLTDITFVITGTQVL